jgi:hypothetical protein
MNIIASTDSLKYSTAAAMDELIPFPLIAFVISVTEAGI